MILCLTVWGTTTVFSSCTISHPHYQLCKGFINTYCGLIFLLEVILAGVRWTSLPFSAGSRTRLTGNKWAVPRWEGKVLGAGASPFARDLGAGLPPEQAFTTEGFQDPSRSSLLKAGSSCRACIWRGHTACSFTHHPPTHTQSPLRSQKPLQAFKQRDLTDGLNSFLWQKR